MTLRRQAARIPAPAIFAVSVLVALGILWRQDALDDIGPVLSSADTSQIIAGFALYLFGLALLCWRWDQVIRMIKGWSSAPRAAEAFLTSVVINYAAPVSLAIPSRAMLTKQALGLTAVQTGAAAFWEVMSDLLVLAAGSLLWIILTGWQPDRVPGDSSTWIIVAVLFVTLLLLSGLLYYLLKRFRSHWPSRMRDILQVSLTFPAKRPRNFAAVMSLSVIFWIVQIGVIWLLLEAVSADTPSVTLVLGLTTLPMLAGMISPVPGGAGIREAAMVAIAGVHGAASAEVAVVAVVYRVALFAAIPILYIIFRLWREVAGSDLPALDNSGTVGAHTNPDESQSTGGIS